MCFVAAVRAICSHQQHSAVSHIAPQTFHLHASACLVNFALAGKGGPVAEDNFDDDYEDDYDSFHQADEESGVQLGTVLPLEGSQADSVLFRNVDWHEWDGGKAGGWPVRWRIGWGCTWGNKCDPSHHDLLLCQSILKTVMLVHVQRV